jgi:hypothetical protein
MKKSNLLSMTNRIEPLFAQFSWPSTNLLTLVAVAIILTLGVITFQKSQEAKVSEIKSVAWYAANQKEARAQNKECFENPGLQSTEKCVNSLHALEMSYKGINS